MKRKWKISTILAALVLLLWVVFCFRFGFDTGSTMRDTERIQKVLMNTEVLGFEKLERTAKSEIGKAEEDAVEAYLLEFKEHADALEALHTQLEESVLQADGIVLEPVILSLQASNGWEWKFLQDMREYPRIRFQGYMQEHGDIYEAWYDDWSDDLAVVDFDKALERAEQVYKENQMYLEQLVERKREADGK